MIGLTLRNPHRRGRRPTNRPAPAAVGVLLSALWLAFASPVPALETDQYYAWGRPLADSTDAVNARFNLELRRALDSFENRQPKTCDEISGRFRSNVRSLLFHPILDWVTNSATVARIPADGEEQGEYVRSNLYSDPAVVDPGTWMPYTPTIEVNGVRIGTDKISHFVSSGWTYYTVYRKAVRKGLSSGEAEKAAAERGILEEKLILGALSSGVLARADLEASFQGMWFYIDLCGGADPVFVERDGAWKMSRPVDLRSYVHPGWDESWMTSIYRKPRWNRVKRVLPRYCDRRFDPAVIEMRRRYAETERRTVLTETLEELVAEGKVADPSRFVLDAVCDEPPPGPEVATASPAYAGDRSGNNGHEGTNGAGGAGDTEAIVDRIEQEERTTARRAVGLPSVWYGSPAVLSGSVGWMSSRLPVSYDCRTFCNHKGPFAQVAAGLGGGQVSAGWAKLSGETWRGGRFLRLVSYGYGFKATWLRTWGDSSREPAGLSYAGAEFGMAIARVGLRVGWMTRVRGDEGSDRIVTWGVGWGF